MASFRETREWKGPDRNAPAAEERSANIDCQIWQSLGSKIAFTESGTMVRTIAVWIFGLTASAIIGGFLGSAYDSVFNHYADIGGAGLLFGAIAGVCLFACLQLWFAKTTTGR
jgi:hypothetical protein